MEPGPVQYDASNGCMSEGGVPDYSICRTYLLLPFPLAVLCVTGSTWRIDHRAASLDRRYCVNRNWCVIMMPGVAMTGECPPVIDTPVGW